MTSLSTRLDHGAIGNGRVVALIAPTSAGDDAAWEVIDFAPRLPDGLPVVTPHELPGLVRPLPGTSPGRIRFDPRPDHGRAPVEPLGNFPQACMHVGPIDAAATIGDLLAARDGGVRAWA